MIKGKGIIESENYYGHMKRLSWILNHTSKGDKILDVGCGTGSYITIPLILEGRDAYGVDVGNESIVEANRILHINGLSGNRFFCKNISEVAERYDVVVCSEVMEHIPDEQLSAFVEQLCSHLKNDGKLIITVPNKNGSFELSNKYLKSFGELLYKWIRISVMQLRKIKNYIRCTSPSNNNVYAASLTKTDTPHVQFFSFNDVVEIFSCKGFRLDDFGGSVMFADYFTTHFLFECQFLYKLNNWLGDCFPFRASGYYFCFRRK